MSQGAAWIDAAARALWAFHSVSDTLSPADVIIGLGSYDLRVAHHAARLWQDGLAPRILFTGNRGNWTSDLFGGTEAEAFASAAKAQGVPQAAIELEPEARNIGENIRFAAALCPGITRAIFITKPQTQLRCRATAQRQAPGITSLITAPPTPYEDQALPHHDRRALICEMVGDLARMAPYAAKGFQTEVPVPPEVQSAADTLIAAGYTDHLP